MTVRVNEVGFTSGGDLQLGLCVECEAAPATALLEWRRKKRGCFCDACLLIDLRRITVEAQLEAEFA